MGPLEVTILGRQCPDFQDYYGGNWLMVRATVKTSAAQVVMERPCLLAQEVEDWRRDLEALAKQGSGEVEGRFIEPNPAVSIAMGSTGRLDCEVELGPEAGYVCYAESYRLVLEDLDQSHLAGLIARLDRILQAYPVLYRDQEWRGDG